MIYYTVQKKMNALHCAFVDVSSGDSSEGMIYYTHHRKIDAPQCVCVDVS
jgi:hypothetical protein